MSPTLLSHDRKTFDATSLDRGAAVVIDRTSVNSCSALRCSHRIATNGYPLGFTPNILIFKISRRADKAYFPTTDQPQ